MSEGVEPAAVWSGTFNLLGVEIKCHTLSDGRRVIEAESADQLLAAMLRDGPPIDKFAFDEFNRWYSGIDDALGERG